MRRWIIPTVGVGLVLVGIIGLAGVVATGELNDRAAPAVNEASDVDAMFIEQMIPHHDDAIAMGDLGAELGEHAELRELAGDIARTQRAENEQMREWYRDWFGRAVPRTDGEGMMGGPMMGGSSDPEDLVDADPFDKAFIEQMVPHHRMAIMMAGMLRAQTDQPEMREFADEIIATQSEEIDRMLEWYDEWYGQ